MCGPLLAWDWFVLDFAYLLVLVGGSLVLRARVAGPLTWLSFGVLGFVVGTFLLTMTYAVQVASAQSADPMALLRSGC